MWPISTKVGSPRNDTPDILDRIDGDGLSSVSPAD